MDRDSFIFYKSFYEAICETDTETQVELYDAICRKALYNEDVNLSGTAKILYTLIKPQIEANSKRYSDGQKGGRPKKETTGFEEEKTTGFENEKPNNNENVNENDNVNDSCVDDLQKIIEFFENNIAPATPYLLEVLKDYSDTFSADMVILAMQKAIEAKAPNIKYIKAILNSWEKKGIKSPLEAEQENVEHKNRVTPKEEKKAYQNYDQRDSSSIDFDSLYAN